MYAGQGLVNSMYELFIVLIVISMPIKRGKELLLNINILLKWQDSLWTWIEGIASFTPQIVIIFSEGI